MTRLAAILLLAGLSVPPVATAAPQSFAVVSVAVEHDGVFKPDPNGHQTPAACARFRLGSAMALKWFRQAREVTQQAWLETLDWTQCGADGTLVTGDARTYHWTLDQSGRGLVMLTPRVSIYLAGPELPL